VLDNCEHVVVPVAGLVERLVAACPNVTVVATSRERLRVDGEHVYTVPALPVGDGDGPAVELFVQRARAVSPEFAPDVGEQAGIAEIVRRLDGLPLAIELAAARLHTHDVAEVAAGLDERFSLLSSGSRTSTRHGSLRAAVAWSFGLLDERLRRTFAELSVFAGSFTAADAAAVCETDVASATDALTQLTERSLVLRAPGRRYVLLETLRAFGAEQLTASGDAEAAGHRHARHQVDWIEDADRRMFDDGAGVIGEITAAVGELRAALGWLLEHGQSELASRLVVALLDYGLLGQRPDVLAWARRVAEAGVPDEGQLAGRVWCVAAYAAWLSGDGGGTAACTERALAAAERSGTIPSEVATIRGNVELFEGRLDEAVGWYGRATEAAVAAGDLSQHLLSRSTGLLARAYADDPAASELADQVLAELGDAVSPMAAYVWHCAGEVELRTDPDRARNRFTRAMELAERTGASLVTGLAGASRASIDARVGDPRIAAADYKRLIADWRRAGVWSTQWTMLRWVAVVLARLGRPRDAAVLEGAVRATTAGHRIFGADEVALAELGQRLRAELGDEGYEEAVREGSVLDGDAAVEHALRAL
jgi:predicted ATPase